MSTTDTEAPGSQLKVSTSDFSQFFCLYPQHFTFKFLTLAISLSLTLRRTHDSKVAIEVISDQLLARSEEVKELEDIDAELNAELEAETRKWHSR